MCECPFVRIEAFEGALRKGGCFPGFVMARRSRLKDGIASARL